MSGEAQDIMNVRNLQETPPWEWPRNAGKILQKTLLDREANEEDRVIAAELAGDLIVMNDRMAPSAVPSVLWVMAQK